MGDITPIMAMCLFGASDALRSAGRLSEAASIAAHTRTAWMQSQMAQLILMHEAQFFFAFTRVICMLYNSE